MWKNVQPVYRAGIQTHDLQNMSLLPSPKRKVFCPLPNFFQTNNLQKKLLDEVLRNHIPIVGIRSLSPDWLQRQQHHHVRRCLLLQHLEADCYLRAWLWNHQSNSSQSHLLVSLNLNSAKTTWPWLEQAKFCWEFNIFS